MDFELCMGVPGGLQRTRRADRNAVIPNITSIRAKLPHVSSVHLAEPWRLLKTACISSVILATALLSWFLARQAAERATGHIAMERNFYGVLTVTLPKGVRLRATTGNGDVTVEKASNDVEIRSGNGDVRITLTAGQVDVTTGNGELDVEGATGPVKAATGNGRVYVLTSSGPVTARTGNGEIDVKMKTLTSTSDMTFATGNGSVSVALPSSFNGEIDASTGNGEFRSDFEIRVIGRLNPHHVHGTIGNGGCKLDLATSNGSITITRE